MPLLRVTSFLKQIFSASLVLVFLSACGGSGPEGAPSPIGGNTGGTATETKSATITLAWEAGYSQSGNVILDSEPRTLLITLKDGDGKQIPNEIVEASVSLGALFPSSGKVSTNENGVASIQIDVSGAEEGEAGAINVVYTDATTKASVSARQTYSATISAVNTTAGLQLEAGIYPLSVLEIDAATTIVAITDYQESLASFEHDRSDAANYSINAVQDSLYVVRVLNALDDPVEGAIVNITTTAGTITPASGNVLTNENGIAYAIVSAGNSDPGAAGTLTATIAESSIAKNFSVGEVKLTLGYAGSPGVIGINTKTDGSVTLSPTGTASLSVTVYDGEEPFNTPLTINFTSSCASSGDALIDTNVKTIKGVATATYEASGCAIEDTITASVAELADVSANGKLTVLDAAANSIRFVSATPVNLSIKGTGGVDRQEFSTLVFEVVDEAGKPKENEPVSLKLSTTTGGIMLTGDLDEDGDLDCDVAGVACTDVSDERLYTNANGRVSVVVNAGTFATSTRLIASITVDGTVLNSVSDLLVISSGLPDQDSFSLSATLLAPGGNDFDGFNSTIVIRASDAFNNPVPEGTAIYFTTEYGKVEDFCTMPALDSETGSDNSESGVCSVIWTSQNPRSNQFDYTTGVIGSVTGDVAGDGSNCADNVNGVPCANQIGTIYGGHTTILAYALGEETFVDANGDGRYNYQSDGVTPELFTDLPEAFIDHNGDGVYGNEGSAGACTATTDDVDPRQANECATWQPGGEFEEFVDANSNGVYDWGNGIYNGSLCDIAAANAGDCETQLIYVSDSVELNAGGSSPFIGIYNSTGTYVGNSAVTIDAGNPTDSRTFYVSDRFNSRLPAGTTVEISSDNCKLSGLTSFEVVDTNAKGIHSYTAFMSEDKETDNQTGFVSITVSVPASAGGVIATSQFACNDDQ